MLCIFKFFPLDRAWVLHRESCPLIWRLSFRLRGGAKGAYTSDLYWDSNRVMCGERVNSNERGWANLVAPTMKKMSLILAPLTRIINKIALPKQDLWLQTTVCELPMLLSPLSASQSDVVYRPHSVKSSLWEVELSGWEVCSSPFWCFATESNCVHTILELCSQSCDLPITTNF